MVESAAVSFGLDLDRFRAAFDSADTKSVADSYVSQAQSDAVNGTPTVLVGKTGAALKAVPYTSVDAEIDRLLK